MRKSTIIKDDDFVNVDYRILRILDQLGITNGKETMLFCKILNLARNDDKACTAGNAYLSTFLCTSERNVRNYLEDLKNKGLLKTYEQKEGMRTTVRYIYPQHKVLNRIEEEMFRCAPEGEEEMFLSSSNPGGEEEIGQTRGRNLPKERNKPVKAEEETFHHIIEYNRVYNNILSNDPTVESQECLTDTVVSYKEENDLPFGGFDGYDDVVDVNNLLFGSYKYENDTIREFMGIRYNVLKREGYDDLRGSLVNEFTSKTGGYSCMNNSAVETYADYLINSDLYCTK